MKWKQTPNPGRRHPNSTSWLNQEAKQVHSPGRSSKGFCLMVQAVALMNTFALGIFSLIQRIFFPLFLELISGIANTWIIANVLIILNWLALDYVSFLSVFFSLSCPFTEHVSQLIHVRETECNMLAAIQAPYRSFSKNSCVERK